MDMVGKAVIPPLYLVTGGCRSGKSAFAQALAESIAPDRTYIATAGAFDPAMAARIEKHRSQRDDTWKTLELLPGSFSRRVTPALWAASSPPLEPFRLPELDSGSISGKTGVILFDCLTLFIAGEMDAGLTEKLIPRYLDLLFHQLFAFAVPIVMVTNEVGLGGISANAFAREFCDMAGTANQRVAAMAKTVVLTVSGIPLVIKGALPEDVG